MQRRWNSSPSRPHRFAAAHAEYVNQQTALKRQMGAQQKARGLQRAATDVWDASGDCLRLLSLPCSEYNVAFKQSRCNHPALLMHRSGGDGGPVHGSGQRLAQLVPRIFHFMGSNKAFQARCEATLKNFSARMASR